MLLRLPLPIRSLHFLTSLSTLIILIHHIRQPPAPPPTLLRSAPSRICPFPIVYNKPPKTGSTTFQRALLGWARQHGRIGISCAPHLARASIQLRDCIPRIPTRCAVVATHLELDLPTRDLLASRLGGELLTVTTTRNPRRRIVSQFLQEKGWSAERLKDERTGIEELRLWLREMNAWGLWNYHTGQDREGVCPLQEREKRVIERMVRQYDVVVDLEEGEVTKRILGGGEFQGIGEKWNVRGGGQVELDGETEGLLGNASCVEEEMHRLFRLRMASLYERVTREPCLGKGRYPEPCF